MQLVAGTQELVRHLRAPDTASIREHAAAALADVCTWSALPKLVLLGIAAVCKLCLSGIVMLGKRRRRHLVMRPLPGLRRGLTIKGVHFSGASVKRGQLMAQTGLQRLWARSKRATLSSFALVLGIAISALFTRPQRQEAVAAAEGT